MFKMIRKNRSDKRGFTLVELIVVLVILAILAAILVPTLLGYINRARDEKDYAAAQSLRVAAQANIDELYAKGLAPDGTTKITSLTAADGDITKANDSKTTTSSLNLAGVDAIDFDFKAADGKITSGYVQFKTNGAYYYFNGSTWTSQSGKPSLT
jgi:type IV pilus assembly protein PilA